MERKEIESRVNKILVKKFSSENEFKKKDITNDAGLETDLGFDSLDEAVLLDYIEEELGIQIPYEVLASGLGKGGLGTVSNLYDIVEKFSSSAE